MLELNTTPILTPPVPAASIMLLRDSSQGLEVFMLKRSQKSTVLKGVYVFPGGKVDPVDTSPAAFAAMNEDPPSLQKRIGDNPADQTQAAAFFNAGCRETLEECGVSLKVSELVAWSRWTTPVLSSFMSKRFDTQFFAAVMPSDQHAVHDTHEAVESVWVRPRQALESYWRGELEMAPVQIMSVLDLSRFYTAQEALTMARARHAPHILPEPYQGEGGRVVTYPGDEKHTKPGPVIPGPTRLRMANERFEPEEGGFEGFFVNMA